MMGSTAQCGSNTACWVHKQHASPCLPPLLLQLLHHGVPVAIKLSVSPCSKGANNKQMERHGACQGMEGHAEWKVGEERHKWKMKEGGKVEQEWGQSRYVLKHANMRKSMFLAC